LAEYLTQIGLKTPQIPYISNLTGKWITPEEATSPGYWAKHLRETVRFADGIRELLAESQAILLEIGPGQTLRALVKQQTAQTENTTRVFSTMRRIDAQDSDTARLLETVGQLWAAGVEVNWEKLYREQRRRVPLPTYSFERNRFWVPPNFNDQIEAKKKSSYERNQDISDWFYLPLWKQLPPKMWNRLQSVPALEQTEVCSTFSAEKERWMVLFDAQGWGASIVDRLREAGQEVIAVNPA